MEWHTPFPRHQYLKRMINKISEIVEDDVTESPSQNNSENRRKKKCICMLFWELFLYKHKRYQKTQCVHETIPGRSYGYSPEFKGKNSHCKKNNFSILSPV